MDIPIDSNLHTKKPFRYGKVRVCTYAAWTARPAFCLSPPPFSGSMDRTVSFPLSHGFGKKFDYALTVLSKRLFRGQGNNEGFQSAVEGLESWDEPRAFCLPWNVDMKKISCLLVTSVLLKTRVICFKLHCMYDTYVMYFMVCINISNTSTSLDQAFLIFIYFTQHIVG